MQLFRNGKLLCYILLVITGCEKDNVDVEGCTDPNALNYNISATISDSLACEYENTTIYSMPSVILGSNVEISIYNNLSFNDINIIPDDLEWSSDTNITSYEQEFEVLHYNMNTHKIIVSTNNYLIKEIYTDIVYKLYFEDYNSGVVLFKYGKLDGENQTTVEVVTSNCYQKPFYYNFITNMEDSKNWHISLQKISVEF